MIILFPEALTLVHYPFLPSYPDPAPTSEVATRIAAYYCSERCVAVRLGRMTSNTGWEGGRWGN
jgi:hypothetical protein